MPIIASTEPALYQVAVISAGCGVMVLDSVAGVTLPVVSIPPNTRTAVQIVTALREVYRMNVIVLGILTTSCGLMAVAERLDAKEQTTLRKVALSELPGSIMETQSREKLQSLLDGEGLSSSPFSRLAWWVDAVDWVEQTAQKKIAASGAIRQISSGGFFTLIQFALVDGDSIWLKATGSPNEHERTTTRVLASLPPLPGDPTGYVPSVLAERPDWNAWLMSGAASPFPELPTTSSETLAPLASAVQSLAHLQIAALENMKSLQAAGAFDQSWRVLRSAAPDVFAFIQEVMPLQTSRKAPILSARRIEELSNLFFETCDIVEGLGLPASVLHGDLNAGNLVVGEQCQFIDWAETYVGCPIISLEHLFLLNRVSDNRERASLNSQLRRRYAEEWARYGGCNKERMERALCFAPFLAPYSALYGRGQWLTAGNEDRLRMQVYVRTLARYMDRAAQDMQGAGCV